MRAAHSVSVDSKPPVSTPYCDPTSCILHKYMYIVYVVLNPHKICTATLAALQLTLHTSHPQDGLDTTQWSQPQSELSDIHCTRTCTRTLYIVGVHPTVQVYCDAGLYSPALAQ